MIERRPIAVAVAVGVAIGLLSMLSTLLVVLALAFWLVINWATRGLEGREGQWVRGGVYVAIVARLIVISTLLFGVDPAQGSFRAFFGDGLYSVKRSLWLRDSALGIPIAPEYFIHAFDPYGYSGYHYVLAAIQIVVGPSPVALHVVSSFFFISALLLSYRLFRRSYGVNAAMLGLGILLFMPSLFAWSVSVLKESFHLGLMVMCLAGVMAIARGRGLWRRAGGMLLTVGSLLAIDTLRSGALAIVLLGLAVGVGMWVLLRSVRIFVPGVVLALLATYAVASRPAVQDWALEQLRFAANRHVGHVFTPGQSVKLLDERFYTSGAEATLTMTPIEATRFLVRGAVAFLLVPLPWEAHSLNSLAYLPEQIVWYLLVLFAVVGLASAWHRDALMTAIVCGFAVSGAMVIAPNSGNIGTLVRHRDLILPFVTWISALGILNVAAGVTRHVRQGSVSDAVARYPGSSEPATLN